MVLSVVTGALGGLISREEAAEDSLLFPLVRGGGGGGASFHFFGLFKANLPGWPLWRGGGWEGRGGAAAVVVGLQGLGPVVLHNAVVVVRWAAARWGRPSGDQYAAGRRGGGGGSGGGVEVQNCLLLSGGGVSVLPLCGQLSRQLGGGRVGWAGG